MKTLKLKVLMVSVVALLFALEPEAWAIVAGFNQDIHMDIDIPDAVANDFHIEGRLKSGAPGGNFSQPPTLISHIDGGFPKFNHSILPDTSDPGQKSFIFRATHIAMLSTWACFLTLPVIILSLIWSAGGLSTAGLSRPLLKSIRGC